MPADKTSSPSGVAQAGEPGVQRSIPATAAISPAEIVLHNAHIVTLDRRESIAQAIAIAAGKILAVGADAEMTTYIAPHTRLFDMAGRTIAPGLIDGHAHMDREALRGIFPALGKVRSINDIQERIAELARSKKPGEWIVTMPIGDPPFYIGVPDNLAEKRWPTRQELDAAAPHNPVYIRSIWGYWRGTLPVVSCANTAALKRAGVTRDTISPVPSVAIQKDDNGDPTGVFIEQDFAPLAELIWFREAARFTDADRLRTLPESAKAYHGFGTTSIFEGHGVASELLRAYRRIHAEGKLTMRATLALSPNWAAAGDAPLDAFVEAWLGWLGEPGLGDDFLKMGGLYVHLGRTVADDARAAAGPYTGWAGFNSNHGLPRDRVKELLIHCAKNDIRPTCITGRTGLDMLDLYEEVDKDIPLKGRRWVISHIDVISPRDIERIVSMGLVLTTQTNNYLYKSLARNAAELKPEQHNDIVPLKSLLTAGVPVSLATDNTPITLWHPVQHTVVRQAFGSDHTFGESQSLSRMEALRCATKNGAYLTFDEAKKGSLEAGKFADLTVLSADPLTVPAKQLSGITALMTMVGGNIVHETPPWHR
jgi:predicted amidohydrolase YtcJ